MVLRWLYQLHDSPVRRQVRTKPSRLVLPHERRGKDMRAAWSKCPSNFTESGSWIKQVLEDVLSDMQIDALVLETQVFKIFAANAIHNLSCGDISVIVSRNISWRFIL